MQSLCVCVRNYHKPLFSPTARSMQIINQLIISGSVAGRMALPLKCVQMLSIKEIALRKVAVALWTNSDILAYLMKFQYHENRRRKWESIIKSIKEKIGRLGIPNSLHQQLFEIVLNIGSEIRSWECFHVKTFNLSCIETFEQASVKLYFTTAETVDDRRMAQEFVLCSKIDVVQRYKMACSYWLEDCIPFLWQELAEKNKKRFSKINRISKGLEYAWPHTYQDGLDHAWRKSVRCAISFHQWAFKLSALKGYKATAQYFFQKLSYKEVEASLMETACLVGGKVVMSKRYSNVLYYLLLRMTPEQQFKLVKELPVSVLSCFLDWPRQDLFLENADLICPYLTLDRCLCLLKLGMYRVVIWNNYFPKFFSEFFKQSPPCFKDYFVNEDRGAYVFLCRFFRSGDEESIKAIFRSLDSANRVNLLFRDKVLELFYDAMLKGKFDLVRLCLQEATLPKKERDGLYTIFCNYLYTEFSSRQNGFDQIFDGLKKRMDPETLPSKFFSNSAKEQYPIPDVKGQKRHSEVKAKDEKKRSKA